MATSGATRDVTRSPWPRLLVSALVAGTLYSAFIAGWPWIGDAGCSALVVACEPLVDALPLGGDVTLIPRPDEGPGALRVRLELQDGFVGAQGNANTLAYLTGAAFLSLWIVTRRSLSRRAISLLFGLGLATLLCVVRIAILVARSHFKHVERCPTPMEHSSLFQDRFVYRALQRLEVLLTSDPAIFIATGLLIWLVVSFRRDDWRRMFEGLARAAPARPEDPA